MVLRGVYSSRSQAVTHMKKLLLATATCLAFVGMANACGTTTTTRICYLRNYDRTHLAQHPDQSVTAMRISLSKGGCDTATTNNDFYIDDKQNSIYLYPKHIILNWGNNDERTLTKGKDDEVFKLDKTVCDWKVED
jgi:hypothetical protein